MVRGICAGVLLAAVVAGCAPYSTMSESFACVTREDFRRVAEGYALPVVVARGGFVASDDQALAVVETMRPVAAQRGGLLGLHTAASVRPENRMVVVIDPAATLRPADLCDGLGAFPTLAARGTDLRVMAAFCLNGRLNSQATLLMRDRPAGPEAPAFREAMGALMRDLLPLNSFQEVGCIEPD